MNYFKISIVIPSYNSGKFLEDAICSILHHNYQNLELIIIDGGSTDNTLDIIKKYEKDITYWISEPDKGQSDALNKGFSKASGDIVSELDADDMYCGRNSLNKVNEFFNEDYCVDVIYGDRYDMDEKLKIIGESRYVPFSEIVNRYEGLMLGPQSAFWKRSLFNKIGMYSLALHYAMDYEFFIRAGLAGAKFKKVPYFFSAMRRHEKSKTEMVAGTPELKKELDWIDKKHKVKKWLRPAFKVYALAFRIIWYIIQGDTGYVLKGFKRRIE